MDQLSVRYEQIEQRIGQACQAAGRGREEVTLLAVSKTRSAREIAALHRLGVADFGENYLQEALAKIHQLADLPLCWHFIGPLQSNKTREVACQFDWVHSVDRLKLARRLSEQRPADQPPLNLCIQVNIDAEPQKAGALPDQVASLAAAIVKLSRLRLRGLMAIPRADSDDQNRAAFRRLAMTLSQLRNTIPALDTLSMGMSDDFAVAIDEGATIIRLGTALFGPRP